MILLKQPIRQWTNGVPKRVVHKYRLWDYVTQSYCMATYKGLPRIRAWEEAPHWRRVGTLHWWLAQGWIIVRPPIGLPVGV